MARLNFLSRLLTNGITKSDNGTCTGRKTTSVTFNLYTTTKTPLIQGKVVEYTRDLLLQNIQAVKNRNSAKSADETNSIHGHSTSTSWTNDSLVRYDFEGAMGVNESKSKSSETRSACPQP